MQFAEPNVLAVKPPQCIFQPDSALVVEVGENPVEIVVVWSFGGVLRACQEITG